MSFSGGLKKIAKKVPYHKLREAAALGGGITLGLKTLPKEKE